MSDALEQPMPIFADVETGLAYLAELKLANPLVAEQQLTCFLDSLLAEPPDPGVLLPLLEQARAPLCFIEEEMARRYQNKPVPLTDEENAAFVQVVAAWRKMGKAYALCARLEEPATDNPDYEALVATILHRCIYYTGRVILEHYPARRELPPGIWLELHGYYESAEEWGVASLPVSDMLESDLQATHCMAAYVALLLIDMANPYGQNARNLNLIRRWANMWAPLVSVEHLDDELVIPSYIVELMKDQALHPGSVMEGPSRDVRQLDTTRLGLQISHVLSQLKMRLTPSQLGLGEDTSGHVTQLLEYLMRPWTQSASLRRFRRFPSHGTARVGLGFADMHYFVSGKEFEQPGAAAAYSREEFDQLFTFRDSVEPAGHALNIRPAVVVDPESWAVVNHSASGFCLSRSVAGERLMLGQLLAVCPHDGERFLLAHVVWLTVDDQGGLLVGLSSLPGVPVPIAVRLLAVDGQAGSERYTQAFQMPALPAVGEEASLVVPQGFYQASRELEAYIGEMPLRVRMRHILQRGQDFERISFAEI